MLGYRDQEGDMIYMMRTMTIQQAKYAEVFQWAVRVARFSNEHYPELNLQILRNVSGSCYQVHWLVGCKSLAVFKETYDRVHADPGYQELTKGWENLVIQSSWVDTFYETVG
jgi:hypothetical protein